MQIIDKDTNLQIPATAACIGFFDGVHRGHQFLIGQLIEEARQRGIASAVITFRNHPRKLIEPQYTPQLISTYDEKMELLAKTDVDYCLVLDFTPELRKLTAREFIQQVLKEKLNTQLLLVGYDHHFGSDRDKGYADYQRYGSECGMEVIKEPDYCPSGWHISSSEIRRALLHGNIAKANELLGRYYQLKGKVEGGFHLGRKIGYPTANITPSDSDKLIPQNGVYAAFAHIGSMRYPAMLNIGCRPTFSDTRQVSIEVHIIGFEGNLYDSTLSIDFIALLRHEMKMESMDALRLQLDLDKKQTLQRLKEYQSYEQLLPTK